MTLGVTALARSPTCVCAPTTDVGWPLNVGCEPVHEVAVRARQGEDWVSLPSLEAALLTPGEQRCHDCGPLRADKPTLVEVHWRSATGEWDELLVDLPADGYRVGEHRRSWYAATTPG